MAIRNTTAQKIELQKEKMEQMESELKRLIRLQKDEEKEARNFRNSKRGAQIESLLPDTVMLSDERFTAFLEKTIANDFGRRVLATFKAEQEKENAKNATIETTKLERSNNV